MQVSHSVTEHKFNISRIKLCIRVALSSTIHFSSTTATNIYTHPDNFSVLILCLLSSKVETGLA